MAGKTPEATTQVEALPGGAEQSDPQASSGSDSSLLSVRGSSAKQPQAQPSNSHVRVQVELLPAKPKEGTAPDAQEVPAPEPDRFEVTAVLHAWRRSHRAKPTQAWRHLPCELFTEWRGGPAGAVELTYTSHGSDRVACGTLDGGLVAARLLSIFGLLRGPAHLR